MTVTAGPGGAVLRADDVELPVAGGPGPQCTAVLHAGPGSWTITGGDGITVRAAGPVPQVFGFRTELPAADGLSVSVRVVTPFATSPTAVKLVLVALQVVAVL